MVARMTEMFKFTSGYITTNCDSAIFPSLISLMVSVDVKHHVYLLTLLSVVRRIFRSVAYLWIVNWFVDLLCLIDVILYQLTAEKVGLWRIR